MSQQNIKTFWTVSDACLLLISYNSITYSQVPLRWLSIEAVKDNLYSSKSDVWAFAIVLWEIGTLGKKIL